MASDGRESIQREILPIPDKTHAGFIAYDAKDPDSGCAERAVRPVLSRERVLSIIVSRQ